ncbi:MAG TPA: thiamine pyrophosphate-dependent enzyme, partial [Paenisporosarcina sp.]|nr:thiamine pyrophosphate-dependent enzyme [Paenisporosarcina sp.]
KVVKEAADRARSGEGPTLIEAVSHRLTAHSSDDDQRQYRTKEDLAEGVAADPIGKFAAYLTELNILNEELENDMNERIMKEVNEATDYAENAPYAAPESALKYVYAEKDGGNA